MTPRLDRIIAIVCLALLVSGCAITPYWGKLPNGRWYVQKDYTQAQVVEEVWAIQWSSNKTALCADFNSVESVCTRHIPHGNLTLFTTAEKNALDLREARERNKFKWWHVPIIIVLLPLCLFFRGCAGGAGLP